ncbi:TPA: hypothetical protein F8R87_08640 [Legionella pneumophila]|nr:hypothetical protein [Legionella pneumophila]
MKNTLKTNSFLGSAILTGIITASLCCIGPLMFLGLGLGSTWISTLTQFEFLRPIGTSSR